MGGDSGRAEAGFDAEKHRIVTCKSSRFSVLSQIKREKLRASCGKDSTFASDPLIIKYNGTFEAYHQFRSFCARLAFYRRNDDFRAGAALAQSGAHPVFRRMGDCVDIGARSALFSAYLSTAFACRGGAHDLDAAHGHGYGGGVVDDSAAGRRYHTNQRCVVELFELGTYSQRELAVVA